MDKLTLTLTLLPIPTPPSCHLNAMSRRQYDDGI